MALPPLRQHVTDFLNRLRLFDDAHIIVFEARAFLAGTTSKNPAIFEQLKVLMGAEAGETFQLIKQHINWVVDDNIFNGSDAECQREKLIVILLFYVLGPTEDVKDVLGTLENLGKQLREKIAKFTPAKALKAPSHFAVTKRTSSELAQSKALEDIRKLHNNKIASLQRPVKDAQLALDGELSKFDFDTKRAELELYKANRTRPKAQFEQLKNEHDRVRLADRSELEHRLNMDVMIARGEAVLEYTRFMQVQFISDKTRPAPIFPALLEMRRPSFLEDFRPDPAWASATGGRLTDADPSTLLERLSMDDNWEDAE